MLIILCNKDRRPNKYALKNFTLTSKMGSDVVWGRNSLKIKKGKFKNKRRRLSITAAALNIMFVFS